VIANDKEFFKRFTIVIATELDDTSLLKLDQICRELGIPLVIVDIYGFMAYLRLVLPEHTSK